MANFVTKFPASERPVSQGGTWTNGQWDGSPLTFGSGRNLQTVGNNLVVANTAAQSAARLQSPTYADNQWCEIDIVNLSNTDFFGVLTRVKSIADADSYLLTYRPGDPQLLFYRVDDTTTVNFVQIGAGISITPVFKQTLRMESTGTKHYFYLDGVLMNVGGYDEATYTSGQPGIWSYAGTTQSILCTRFKADNSAGGNVFETSWGLEENPVSQSVVWSKPTHYSPLKTRYSFITSVVVPTDHSVASLNSPTFDDEQFCWVKGCEFVANTGDWIGCNIDQTANGDCYFYFTFQSGDCRVYYFDHTLLPSGYPYIQIGAAYALGAITAGVKFSLRLELGRDPVTGGGPKLISYYNEVRLGVRNTAGVGGGYPGISFYGSPFYVRIEEMEAGDRVSYVKVIHSGSDAIADATTSQFVIATTGSDAIADSATNTFSVTHSGVHEVGIIFEGTSLIGILSFVDSLAIADEATNVIVFTHTALEAIADQATNIIVISQTGTQDVAYFLEGTNVFSIIQTHNADIAAEGTNVFIIGVGFPAYIKIFDGSGAAHDYTSYYDRTKAPITYSETYDRRRGRTKTGQLTLFNADADFAAPQPDNVVKIYRDDQQKEIIFGGVVIKVRKEIEAVSSGGIWLIRYTCELAGFDPTTLQFRDIAKYERLGIKSGQVIKDLLTTYAPWINTTNVEVATSAVIKHIQINRKKLDEIINLILEKTAWSFYVDDDANAFFNSPANLQLNWNLEEGVQGARFPQFNRETLQIETNTDESLNEIVYIGGEAKGGKYTETFIYNGQEAKRPLQTIPFGLGRNVLFFDTHDGAVIDAQKWYEEDPGNKFTQSLGRLQINSAVSNTGILVSRDVFSRDDNVEFRVAEFEVVSATGKPTIGFHNGTLDTNITNFLHAVEFGFTGGFKIREGASTFNPLTAITIGVGVYSIRILIKAAGGAIYFMQGGRTGTPKELGELGSKNWTKLYESSADTTAFLAVGIRSDLTNGTTIIRTKVSTDINISVVLKNGGQLGLNPPVTADTNLMVGVLEALDFELDCFIGVENGNPFISFFTDNEPLGTVVVNYFGIDTVLRERVTDPTAQSTVDARSALTGDTGIRSLTIQNKDISFLSQDARDLLVAILNDYGTLKYRGVFETNTVYLDSLSPKGAKPYAGQRITINLPNAANTPIFSELITSVNGEDQGAGIYKYSLQFGDGQIDLQRLLLNFQKHDAIEIIDQEPAIDVDSATKTAAATSRPDTPTMLTAVFDNTGISISWSGVAGATQYEVRDNAYRGQGQGGSFVYQLASGNTYVRAAATIITDKKRSYAFFIWAVDTNGVYSKYPLCITVENPAPVPQPIKDLQVVDGLHLTIRFEDEKEPDILSTGRKLQYALSRDMLTSLTQVDVSKTALNYDFNGAIDTVYFVRYGLRDFYTDGIGDILWSGIREVKTGIADLTGTTQYINGNLPDNQPIIVSGRRIDKTSTDGSVSGWWLELNFTYTQAAVNKASEIVVVFRIETGTVSGSLNYADNCIILAAPNTTSLTRYRVTLKGAKLTDHVACGFYSQFIHKNGIARNVISVITADLIVSSWTNGTDSSHTPIDIQGEFFNTYSFNSFVQTAQYRNDIAPDNSPTGFSADGGTNVGCNYNIGISWSYTQGTNPATHFGIIFKFGGGTPTFSDPFIIVESTVRNFTFIAMPPFLYSFGVFAFAVTKSGITRNTTIATVISSQIPSNGNAVYTTNVVHSNSLFGTIDTVGLNILVGNFEPVANNTYKFGKSGVEFSEIWGVAIYRNGTEINSIYAAISHSHTKGDLPAAVAYEDEANTFTSLNDFPGGLKPRRLTGTTVPTPNSGELLIWHDTSGGGATWLVVNDGGTTVKIQLT